MEDGTIEVPLRGRDGSIRAYALIDAADAETVLAHRWCLHNSGCAQRGFQLPDGRWGSVLLHRVVVGLEYGDPRDTDHIDRDPLNCRRSNLRIATHAQNHQNRAPGGNRGSRSRFRGVTAVKGRWRARVRLNGRLHDLGYYSDEEDAGAAASAFRAAHMPFSVEAAA